MDRRQLEPWCDDDDLPISETAKFVSVPQGPTHSLKEQKVEWRTANATDAAVAIDIFAFADNSLLLS